MDPLQRAVQLYREGQLYEALESAQVACERAPKDPEAWGLLARLSRHAGLTAASDDAFRRAAALDPHHRLPCRVSPERFQELVAEVAAAMATDTGPIRIRPLPDLEEVRRGLDPGSLWLEDGGTAVLFQVNHENLSASEAELRERIVGSLGELATQRRGRPRSTSAR
jgi:tetratricopeptide (TPR) repeat protein